MQDLTRYSDNELSLQVFNTEQLYKVRYNRSLLEYMINECFIYTSKQLDVLYADLQIDKKEINNQ